MIISQVALGDQQETGKVSPSRRKATSDTETRGLGSSALLAHLRRGTGRLTRVSLGPGEATAWAEGGRDTQHACPRAADFGLKIPEQKGHGLF